MKTGKQFIPVLVVLVLVMLILVAAYLKAPINNPPIAEASSKESSRADRILSPGTLVGADKTRNGKSIAHYAKAAEANPDDPNTYRSRVDAHFRRALIYERKRDYDKAIAEYTRAIEILPRNTLLAGYLLRGKAYQRFAHKRGEKSDYDKAVADYTKAIELDPDCAPCIYNRGTIYLGRHDFDKAIADFTKAIELNPEDRDAYYGRGIAYAQKGEHDLAIAGFTKTIKLDPKAEAYFCRGVLHEEKGNYELAISDYSRTIQMNPKNDKAYGRRAKVYVCKGQFHKAIADFTKAIELNPEEGDAYYGRGIAYHRVGNFKKAWEDVEKAEALGKQVDPEVLKAISYFTLGSHKDDVVKAQGTPDSINRWEILDREVWWYGPSTVEFSMQEGRVTEWDNCGNLKVWLGPGQQFTRSKPWAMKQMELLQALRRGQQFTRTNPPEKGRITCIGGREDEHTAMIGTEVVGEGDIIQGVTVVKIYEDRVVFEKGAKRWTQEVGDAPDPAWR